MTLDTESERQSEHDVVEQQSGDDDQEQKNSEDEDASMTRLRQIKETDPGTLDSRQLSQLLEQAEDKKKRSQERRRRRLECTRSSLIELGLLEKAEEEIIQDPDVPLPPPLKQTFQDEAGKACQWEKDQNQDGIQQPVAGH